MGTLKAYAPPPIQSFIRTLSAIAPLGDESKAALSQLQMRIVKVAQGVDLVREGDRPNESCLVFEGFVCRYKIVAGGQRQIISMHLQGEIPDLHSLHLTRMDHSLAALTEVSAGFISHSSLLSLTRRHPEIADAFWRATLIDSSIFRETIANIGRRTALQRLAHLFCEAWVRMRRAGLADEQGLTLPLSQAELAEALGLSPVHVNRTLQTLRREGLIESRGRYHGILDWDRLRRLGDFDPAYLHLSGNDANEP